MLTYLHQLAVNQLEALDSRYRLIVIHPNYIDQHMLLTDYLQRDDAYYVRFDGDDLVEADLQSQMEMLLESQIGSKELPEQGTLLLDELDRATVPAMLAFLSRLLGKPGNLRCLVFTRQLPVSFLQDDALGNQITVLPVDRTLMLVDYTLPKQEDVDLLEVRAFGEGHVYLNGKLVDNWDGVLPRSLFLYLVDRGMTKRNEIFETFWPSLPVREATNVFHVTKRKISEVLGIDLTAYWSGFYRISPNINLTYDVVQFTETVNESAILPPDESLALLDRGLHLYRGHFLSAMNMPWVRNRRSELAQNFGEAQATLAKALEDNGQYERALGLYLSAAAYNRNREDLTASIMNLYRKLGMHEDALVAYTRLADGLHSELGVAPAPNLQQLAADIRSEMS